MKWSGLTVNLTHQNLNLLIRKNIKKMFVCSYCQHKVFVTEVVRYHFLMFRYRYKCLCLNQNCEDYRNKFIKFTKKLPTNY